MDGCPKPSISVLKNNIFHCGQNCLKPSFSIFKNRIFHWTNLGVPLLLGGLLKLWKPFGGSWRLLGASWAFLAPLGSGALWRGVNPWPPWLGPVVWGGFWGALARGRGLDRAPLCGPGGTRGSGGLLRGSGSHCEQTACLHPLTAPLCTGNPSRHEQGNHAQRQRVTVWGYALATGGLGAGHP